MGQATIKDIARTLGLSPSTVSRALNDHPDISDETKRRVQTLAEELDYHPNSIAQSLQKKQSTIIGIVAPQIKHVFFASVVAGITDIAYEGGYTVMICSSNENYEREEINIKALISQRVAGLLISIAQSTQACDHFELLKRRKIPVVFFDRVCEDENVSKVVVDDYNGAYQAVEYLIGKGYRRIAHLGGPESLNICLERARGYRDALKAHQMDVHEDWIMHTGLNEEHGSQGLAELLDNLPESPDAVFCVNDPVAIGAYAVLKERGLKIPDDVALLGFSDNPIASLVDPPLTTVRQPAYEMGRRAAALLLKQIEAEDENSPPVTETLKTELIIRQST